MGAKLSDYLAKRAQAPFRHLLERICTHSFVSVLRTREKADGLATPREIEWYTRVTMYPRPTERLIGNDINDIRDQTGSDIIDIRFNQIICDIVGVRSDYIVSEIVDIRSNQSRSEIMISVPI